MDQKDNSAPLKKLASATELRGKKAGGSGGKKGGKKKMWLSLLGMVIVLGVAVGAYFLSDVIKPEEEPEATLPPSKTVKVIDHPRADVVSVKVEAEGQEPYTVLSEATTTGEGDDAKTIYTYSIEGKPEFKLNQTTAGSIIGYAANLTATQQVADNAEDLSAYGLSKPALKATMSYTDGSQEVWLFGDKVPSSSGYYFCKQGTRAVFTVYSSAYTTLSSELNSLYTLEMPVTISDPNLITSLIIEQKGKDTIELGYLDDTEGTISITRLKLKQPIYYDAHADRASAMFTAVQSLTITGYAGELSELEDTGLDDPRAHVRFSDEEGNTVDFRIGNFCGTDKVYVQVDDTDAVYLTNASSLTFLDNANVGYLVDQFANLVNIQLVDKMQITTADKTYEITITREPLYDENGNPKTNAGGQQVTEDTYTFNGKEADEDLFKKLYQVIIGTLNSKVSDDWYIDGDVAVSVHYDLHGEPSEFTVEYLEYDEDYYAVRRDGLTLFLIKREKIDSMVESLQQFEDGTFTPQ